MPVQLMQLAQLLVMFAIVGLMWVIKLLIDRQRNAKRADNHILVEKVPVAGKTTFELCPIETIGGQTCVRYPRAGESSRWPIHWLSSVAVGQIDYPLGKMHFVQATIGKITFLGDDVEALSNLSSIPIVSAQRLASQLQGVSMATDEVMHSIKDESLEGKLKKPSTLIWVYILDGVLALLIITAIVMIVSNTKILPQMAIAIEKLLTAGGLK